MHLKSILLHTENYPTNTHYPYTLEVLQKTKRLEFNTSVTFFAGENGTGKSTLLEAMATKCGIHIWGAGERKRFEVNPFEKTLYKFTSVKWVSEPVPGSYFDSELFHNFARYLDEWAADDPGMLDYFGGKSLMTQSHGQSLMAFFENRYKIKGLYLMDEPETALSPSSQIALLKLLTRLGKNGQAQFIIATHSPILLAYPGAVIYDFDTIPVQKTAYEDTRHYQIYREFMTDRKKFCT